MSSPDVDRDEHAYAYERVVITGTLECRTNLHAGSGFEGVREPRNPKADHQSRRYSEVCLDAAGRPYIPASTLRGYICQRLGDTPSHEKLIGTARRAASEPDGDNTNDYGAAGALRVYDATWPMHCGYRCDFEAHVAIDPITGAAAEHKLFTDAMVASGSRFEYYCELDRVTDEELRALLGVLRSFDGKAYAQLGKGKTRMQGMLQWANEAVKVLYKDQFTEWIKDDSRRALEEYYCQLDVGPATAPSFEAPLTLALVIKPTAPLLVNDPELNDGEREKPDVEFMRTGNKVRIPAASLKGLLRARCRKILMTLVQDRDDFKQQRERADALIGELFGKQNLRGRLRISDAEAAFTKHTLHKQTFNAIDRFTGGVADKKLYSARAVEVEALPFFVHLDRKLLDNSDYHWALGLLIYALRDAMEGDLAIGWGKSKGFGSFKVSVKLAETTIGDWDHLLETLGSNGLHEERQYLEYARALERKIRSDSDRAPEEQAAGEAKA